MFSFSNPHITIAQPGQVPVLVQLLNSAYRGEGSKQGWTTEAHLIAGDVRSDESDVQEVMAREGSVFLIYTNEAGVVIACVNLQKINDKIYLGMFAVQPGLQGGGIGKQMLQAAEAYAKQVSCKAIFMSVISVRSELIAWYMRQGYRDTGTRKPFVEDGLTGKHLQPLEFVILEKETTDD
jgi:ribosomal protein S18 acetylase RimI-like enzyme